MSSARCCIADSISGILYASIAPEPDVVLVVSGQGTGLMAVSAVISNTSKKGAVRKRPLLQTFIWNKEID